MQIGNECQPKKNRHLTMTYLDGLLCSEKNRKTKENWWLQDEEDDLERMYIRKWIETKSSNRN